MTTDTLERTDTGSFAPVRLAHRPAVAPVSSGNPLAGWVPPSSWADEPTPLYDGVYPDQDHRDYTHADGVIRAAAKAERDQAALLAAFIDERAAWAAAEMRQIVEPLAAEQRQQHAATTYGHLPPAPARELTPEALDAEHQQRANGHAGLAALSQRRGVNYADDPAPVPEPRHLLRAELRALQDDLRRAWSELRAWRPWKRGEQ